MQILKRLLFVSVWLNSIVWVGYCAEKVGVPTYVDSKSASERPEFAIQGEYEADGKGVQIADLGRGEFHVLTYSGGLPGADWNGDAIKAEILKRVHVDKLVEGLKRVGRRSPTLGEKAPEGAMVIFDGKPSDLVKGQVEGGLLWSGGATTLPTGDFELHLEFRVPYKPARPLSNQDRGNSGIYIFGNYEVQILDTFGLDFDTDNNALKVGSLNSQWCGSFYKFKTPDVPMAFPPLQWQTYDIIFTAPRFEGEKKVKNARATVRHNGVLIHDDLELPSGTGNGAKRPEASQGTILFQGHGNPVAFRNIWLLEKK